MITPSFPGWHIFYPSITRGVEGSAISCIVVIIMLLTGCGSDDYTYSSLRLGLFIDNSTHQDATLASAMNPASPGVFCRISYSASNRSYAFSSNQGQSSTSVFNAQDTQRGNSSRIGMNNGVIVGYGNLSTSETGGYSFFAYDAQCPNCFDYNAVPLRNYPLTMNSAGIATCANCKREYNMNTGGNCTNNSGNGMTQYRASTTGALGILVVN